MSYIIQINLNPEIFSGIPHFFWCIFEQNSYGMSNMGHGWATSAEQAFHDAQSYINIIL